MGIYYDKEELESTFKVVNEDYLKISYGSDKIIIDVSQKGTTQHRDRVKIKGANNKEISIPLNGENIKNSKTFFDSDDNEIKAPRLKPVQRKILNDVIQAQHETLKDVYEKKITPKEAVNNLRNDPKLKKYKISGKEDETDA